MAYESTVWLGSIAALCPSEDSVGDGTTTLTDFTGVSNGTLTNMVVGDWVADDGKQCLDFDGSNDHVITVSTPISAAKCFGFAAKFRRLANTGTGFCAGFGAAVTTFLHSVIIYHFSDGNLYVHVGGVNYGYAAVSLTNQGWRSLVINFDGTQSTNATRLQIWLDGVALTLTFSGTIPAQLPAFNDTTMRLVLGAAPYSTPVYGVSRIDDVRVNLRLFSDAERAEIDASRGGTYAEASGGGGGARMVNTRGGADQ
jgi:hypothetical protein